MPVLPVREERYLYREHPIPRSLIPELLFEALVQVDSRASAEVTRSGGKRSR